MKQVIITSQTTETTELEYESSSDSGIRSSCHDSLLDTDIYETCLPDLSKYLSLLAGIAGEGFF